MLNPRPSPACRLCELWTQDHVRTICVSGRFLLGPDGAPILPVRVAFVGQSPGPDENRDGFAFVGPAGQLLDRFIGRHLPGTGAYLTNAVRCFPGWQASGGMRAPRKPHCDACFPYLHHEIEQLRPELIVPMGKEAICAVLDLPLSGPRSPKVGDVAGQKLDSRWGVPCVPLHHPAYVRRNPGTGEAMWEHQWQKLLAALHEREMPKLPGQARVLVPARDALAYMDAQRHGRPGVRCALDLETTGLDPFEPGFRVTWAGFSDDGQVGTVVDCADAGVLRSVLRYAQGASELVVHNAPFDCTVLGALGHQPQGRVIDTKALAFLWDERQQMKLEALVARFVPSMAGLKDFTRGDDSPLAWAMRCAYDAMATFRLARELESLHQERDAPPNKTREGRAAPVSAPLGAD